MVIKVIRKRFGRKAFKPNANREFIEGGKRVDDFYDVKKMSFEKKKTVIVEEGENGEKGKGVGKNEKGKKGKKGEKGKKTQVTTEMVEKDVVFVKDVDPFVKHVSKLRGLDPAKTTIRINMDGGQGSIKVDSIYSIDSIFKKTKTYFQSFSTTLCLRQAICTNIQTIRTSYQQDKTFS